MEETQSKMWFSGVAVLPYLVLAGLYTWLIDGHRKDFMVAAVVLIGGRILYAVLDSITSSIAWRVYARKRTTAKMRKLFEDEGLRYPAETLSLYLLRIENTDAALSGSFKSAMVGFFLAILILCACATFCRCPMTTDFVLDALEQALYSRRPSGDGTLIHHSDSKNTGTSCFRPVCDLQRQPFAEALVP
jgi:hypothetical protein